MQRSATQKLSLEVTQKHIDDGVSHFSPVDFKPSGCVVERPEPWFRFFKRRRRYSVRFHPLAIGYIHRFDVGGAEVVTPLSLDLTLTPMT